jgi:hypothetical protein
MALPNSDQSILLPRGALGPLLLLRKEKEAPDPSDPASDTQTERELKADPALCCSVCMHPITSVSEQIEQLGQHEHHCTNPHGIQFLIGCFASAQGCENVGDWVSEYTWFSGYLWRYSLCSACHTHLGWQFKSDQDSFFGLIKDRLVNYEHLH